MLRAKPSANNNFTECNNYTIQIKLPHNDPASVKTKDDITLQCNVPNPYAEREGAMRNYTQ